MELKERWFARETLVQQLLRWVNLRPEESERTLLMFAFYTTTSIGLRWAEDSTIALFLGEYGANSLPWIYIGGAIISSGLSLFYSWLQKFLPLRFVIVAIAPCMIAPLLLLRVGLSFSYLAVVTVFLLQLWVDALYVLNELNTSITANQLFNIREIKRTYPLVSSGILVADVLSGFSLPLLLQWVGLRNVILVASVVMVMGAGILLYLTQNYQQSFPDAPRRRVTEEPTFATRRLRGPLRQYAFRLLAFFGLVQVLGLLINFQYLSQLELNFTDKDIASFLGLFGGILGLFELATQLFISSRAVERLGVIIAAAILPASIVLLLPGTIAFLSLFLSRFQNFFWGLIVLKFLDELLRYTFVASTGPVLFQPIPEAIRSRVQTLAGGIAEAFATGSTGVLILATLWFCRDVGRGTPRIALQSWVLVAETVVLALSCLVVVWFLRSRYVDLLVLGAERGQLSVTDVDLRVLKRAVVEALERSTTEADKSSCIELLSQIDPQSVGEVLAPLLPRLSPALQYQGLEVILAAGASPAYLNQVRALLETSATLRPEVFAVALRYIWLSEPDPDLRQLEPYLRSQQDPIIRGTAAVLILRRGTPLQKAEATNTLRRMLTHKQERERVMGVRALSESIYLQALRLHIPNLLQDQSLRVRCAILETIAATHLEEYYPSLVRGLQYKSTRSAAITALVRLENEALPMLVRVAADIHRSDLVRMYAWRAIGQIGTLEAIDALVAHLVTSWGTTRRNILRTLLQIPKDAGIEGVLDRLRRSGIEVLIEQELMFLGQTYAARVDLENSYEASKGDPAPLNNPESQPAPLAGLEAELLHRALNELQTDGMERLFLLMRLLYPVEAIQAAAFNLRSKSGTNLARGLEILDHTLDLRSKRVLLSVLDRRPPLEKLQSLSAMMTYQPLPPSERLRRLLDLRHFLSDWSFACCLHLARTCRWKLTTEQVLASLRHPTGFVREAAIAYLSIASPRALPDLLPQLKNDSNPLVAAQVQQLIALGMVQSKETSATMGTTPSRTDVYGDSGLVPGDDLN